LSTTAVLASVDGFRTVEVVFDRRRFVGTDFFFDARRFATSPSEVDRFTARASRAGGYSSRSATIGSTRIARRAGT
jgi:hypothetical protein